LGSNGKKKLSTPFNMLIKKYIHKDTGYDTVGKANSQKKQNVIKE
jgi:hypothetical protein